MSRTCQIANCSKPARQRGWCHFHYCKWWKHGDPLHERPTAEARFWMKVNKIETGCWEWTGAKFRDGYGLFYVASHGNIGAHRFSYRLAYGDIPEGLQLDHLCRVRHCVRPDHLEPVTVQENIRRGMAGKLNHYQKTKTHCPQGHPYDTQNTLFYKGTRRCRECSRVRAYDHSLRARGMA